MLRCLVVLFLLCGFLNIRAVPLSQAVPPASAAEPMPDNEGVYTVSPALTAPVLVYQVDPEYSEQARRKKTKGEIIVDVVVDKTGKVRNARIDRGLGSGLDEAALRCVEQYRFKPARLHSEPVPVRMSIAVNFQIF